MVINGDVISLNKREIFKLIEKECQSRLHMTVKEFIQKQKEGQLPKSTAVDDIGMLLKLVK